MPISLSRRWRSAGYAASAVLALAGLGAFALSAGAASAAPVDNSANTTTPIKHVVVIFDENESYDHYFGTYPNAANLPGETPFTAAAATPASDNYVAHPNLLGATNPNSVKPARLTPAEALTCSQNHSYTPEQKAYDNGAMDKFPESTQASSGCATAGNKEYNASVMDYFDGNTVTGLWNYAQNYTMSDNMRDTNFGPSTPGALNLISGNDWGGKAVDPFTGAPSTNAGLTGVDPTTKIGTVSGDGDPAFDDCSDTSHAAGSTTGLIAMQGQNIGDLLNTKGVSWGWFQGGFTPSTPWDGTAGHYASCQGTTHQNIGGSGPEVDYNPHHSPFEYYQSTSNPHHLPPASDAEIGHDGQANHNYDVTDFDKAVAENNIPAVSFIKPPYYEDAHPGNSDPIDEQHFLVNEINEIQSSPEWASTAVIVTYDDSDGWYDHAFTPITNGSNDTVLGDTSMCSSQTAIVSGEQDRCGPGPRLPFLVISPYTKANAIDHTAIEQASAAKFIESNWSTGPIGGGSMDASAGSIDPLFDFTASQNRSVLLNANGTVASIQPISTASTTSTAPGLPATGVSVNVPWMLGGAGLLILAGGVFLLVRRLRRPTV